MEPIAAIDLSHFAFTADDAALYFLSHRFAQLVSAKIVRIEARANSNSKTHRPLSERSLFELQLIPINAIFIGRGQQVFIRTGGSDS